MRLEALAVLTGLTSSLGVGAIRPRFPSAPPYPSGPGNSSYSGTGTSIVPATTSSYTPTGQSPPPPSKCSGQTLNVLGASLDWWYTRTLYHVVSTLSVQYNRNDTRTGWTVLPATTPFDLASAMASPTCSSTLTWNSYWNISLWDVNCTPAPTPVAASTTVITQTAYKQLNASTGTGPLPDVVKTPPPATITIASSGGQYAEGTAFVYFSAYEIMTKSETTYANGTVGCAAATHTYPMETPFSFEFLEGDLNGTHLVNAGVTGDVNPAFLSVVGVSKAAAGTWEAAPTVAVIVQDIYVAQAVLAAAAGPLMTTESILQTPQPTLPSGFTTGPAETGFPSIGFTGHVESTAPSLQTPTPIRTPGGKPTKPTKPGNGTPTKPSGGKPTNPNPGHGSPTPGGGKPKPTRTKIHVGHIVSAIISAVKPTNALQVLQQATHTFKHDSPTASAINQGLKPGGSNNHNNRVVTGPNGKHTLVVGGTTFAANSKTEFHLGTATLTPGGTVVMHGTTVSLAPSLSAVVVNGHTHTASRAAITPAAVLTVGGSTFAPSNGPTYVIDGETLTPGGVITAHGTTISLGPGGSSVVVNGLTQDLGTASPASITAPPVLTIGGEKFTAINNGYTYVINGETLTPGEMETVTIDGKTYIVSLAPGATVLMIETEGPNGQVTATTYETLFAGSGPRPTVTDTVSPASGSQPTSGPSQTGQPGMQNSADSLRSQLSVFGISLTTIALAILL